VMNQTVTIGGAQGFYGDALEPVATLADACDYLVMDGLAELTLAIVQNGGSVTRPPGECGISSPTPSSSCRRPWMVVSRS
jgi:hypothetical protein